MKTLRLWLISLLLAVISSGTSAHHSFNVDYDATQVISVSGTVTEVLFANPHVEYFIQSTDSGEAVTWNIQAQSVNALTALGWTKETLEPGDQITAHGHPSRRGSPRIYLRSATLEDGRQISVLAEGAGREATTASTDASTEVLTDLPSSNELIKALTGSWTFDIDKRLPGAPFQLEISPGDEQMDVVLDHETIEAKFSGDELVLFLDRENAGGFHVRLELRGSVEGEDIRGTVKMIEGSTGQANLDASSFVASRVDPEFWVQPDRQPATPADFTGVWRRTIGVGPIGRTNPELNAAGLERFKLFESGKYDPSLRCMSVGPMRKYADPGAIEFMQTDDRATLLFGSKNDIRRFWLNRESHNPERTADVMGESIAHWDGSTLVIDTRNMRETVLTHNAEPISANAQIIERYWLEDDGHLTMEATLHDPTYYEAPVVRRTQWVRDDSIELLVQPCDPDTFYRGMQFDGSLDEYFENQPKPVN